ncbi:hypothetical protein PtrSN002B_010135 [Pyrenophora tritici-repentis]|uniref:Uncharacterized protein n=1 Tax=Pyrenophora tritici-repentis TaxID=45151 RepID=A0A2W1CUF0_9PLEO|nr:hypothetical protein PtrM4_133200 [Pyrenophora tritici-repentis]KAG9376354.1 hypothetical protein A1F94_012901 [Pyrenophora tritici-repentis]KAI0570775.1 hypothetical protein Alg215_10844 [Pyrenophora tritici-repentis]KAI0587774.1 hypothetical protein Alg130_03687 [Pyrenophora tritici-repentis]KAI0612130.1 hypothetical protein TUN205_03637 [Pyrenophora tritici-repentis]
MDATQASALLSTEQKSSKPAESDTARSFDRWHVSFRVPLGIVLFMLFGIAFALGHHLYYNALDGQPVIQGTQEWAIRIGTGLAFLAKACLIASAAISYQQQYWRVLRSRPMSIGSIDDIMSLLANPACFCNWEVWRKAWSSAIIALAIWCMPLAAITPPAALTAAVSVSQERLASSVPIVSWRNVSFANTGGRNEFYDAGQNLYRVVTSSAYSGTILPMTPLYPNYTYPLTFQGPKLRCGDVTNQTLFDLAHLNPSPESMDIIGYNATVPSEEVQYPFLPRENRYDIWFLTPTRNFTCEMWNVTYTATFSFTNGEQSIAVTDAKYDHRFVEPKDLPGDLCPYDLCSYKAWYKAVSAMLTGQASQGGAYSTFKSTTRVLQTALIGCPEMSTAAAMSNIVTQGCPEPSLERAVEALSQNATLSLFGALPSVYFPIGKFDMYGRIANATVAAVTTTRANLTISTTHLIYNYNARSLLLPYSAAVFTTVVILIAGLYALWSNGVSHTSSFSGLVRTTRNKDLDDWMRGHCLGSDPVDKDVAVQKLQYGLLNVDKHGEGDVAGSVPHAAFGFPDTVTRLKKGDQCM